MPNEPPPTPPPFKPKPPVDPKAAGVDVEPLEPPESIDPDDFEPYDPPRVVEE